MDCSTTESAIVPTISTVSICENPSYSAQIKIPTRNLLDFSTDQTIPILHQRTSSLKDDNHSTEVSRRL